MMITVNSIALLRKLKTANRDIQNFSSRGVVHDYLQEMWQVGHDQAQADYDSAVTIEGDKANQSTEVQKDPEWDSDGFNLVAKGDDILFLEFGTGIQQSELHPWGSQFGYIPRSYSAINKQFLFEPKTHHFHGQWPHEKRLHWGQNPAKGMYNASREMRYYLQHTPLKVF